MTNKKSNLIKEYMKTIKSFEISSETYRWWKNFFALYPLSYYDILGQRENFVKENPNTDVDLYIHIPFCFKLCTYCYYYKEMFNKDKIIWYAKFVEDYIDFIAPAFRWFKFKNLYIWWGTPSLLNENLLENLLKKIKESFEFDPMASMDFEWNPLSLSESKIKILNKYWINRVSMWVQTLKQDILAQNNRWYQTLDSIKNVIENLKKHNIEDINIDLLIGLSEDEKEDFLYSLEVFSKLDINTIVAYWLSPTSEYIKKFFENNQEKFFKNLNLQVDNIHKSLSKEIHKFNFEHYNIDKESKHCRWFNVRPKKCQKNAYSDIWNNSILGIWPSARSYINWKLIYNQISHIPEKFEWRNVDILWKNIVLEDEILFNIIIDIRDKGMLDKIDFKNKFGIDIFEKYNESIDLLKNENIIKIYEEKIYFEDDVEKKVFGAMSFFSEEEIEKKLFYETKKWKHIIFEFDGNRILMTIWKNMNIYISNQINNKNIKKYHLFLKYIKSVYNIYQNNKENNEKTLVNFFGFVSQKNHFGKELKIYLWK